MPDGEPIPHFYQLTGDGSWPDFLRLKIGENFFGRYDTRAEATEAIQRALKERIMTDRNRHGSMLYQIAYESEKFSGKVSILANSPAEALEIFDDRAEEFGDPITTRWLTGECWKMSK
jgi:predicted chitinase